MRKIQIKEKGLILLNYKIDCSLQSIFKLKLQKQFINWGTKNGFQKWKRLKSHKEKNPPTKLPEWFGPELLILFVFIKMVWLIRTNWCFQQQQKMLPNSVGCTQMYLDLYTQFCYWLTSKLTDFRSSFEWKGPRP